VTSPGGPIVITGGSGFVGANVVRTLLDRGCEVHALLRHEARLWRLEDVLGRVEVHEADVADEKQVRQAISRIRPRGVLHLATEGAYESQADPQRIFQTNLLGTLHLLQAAEESGTGLFVNVGSSSEYGFKSEAMCESDRVEPNSYYAVAKAAQTHLTALVSRRSDVPAVSLRLFSLYGPWEEPSRLIPTLIRRARAGEPLDMADPEIARDFVYVDDAVELMTDFECLARHRGDVFNVGSGVQTTLTGVVDAVQAALGDRSEVRWNAFEKRRWDTQTWVADPRHAAESLGWRARTSFADGIVKTAAWMATRESSDASRALVQ
jgi:nucleoside-diphosphate-sugar epimerase